MKLIEMIFGILLAAMSLCLVAAVLLQPGKDKRLSGAIAGGADTFFSKGKAGRWDRVLGKATVAMCVLFFVLIVVMYCMT